jgi:hypothetical protein
VDTALRLMRDALRRLSLNATAQRAEFQGAVVTDELALDFDNALQSFRGAREADGNPSEAEIDALLTRLEDLLSAPPAARFWDAGALDRDPDWEEARAIAREALSLLAGEE